MVGGDQGERKEAQLLAYVFRHRARAGADAVEYKAGLVAFHRSLRAESPAGFRRSLSCRVEAAPWIAGGDAAGGYEDWYVVDDSAALDPLNAAAVSGARRGPHDRAAAGAAAWPEGMRYAEFEARLRGWIGEQAAVWQRQMVLGPASEYCVLGGTGLAPPEKAGALVVVRAAVGGARRSHGVQTAQLPGA